MYALFTLLFITHQKFPPLICYLIFYYLGIIAEAKVDIIKSAIGRIGFTNNIISDLFQNLISVPVKYIVQQKESNSKTTQTVTTTIKSTKQKGMISKIIPWFSIKVICESFKTTNVVYINILAQVGCNSQTILAVNDAKLRQSNVMNSKSNQNCQSEPSMMIINEMIKSLTNLKSYIKLVEFEDTQAHQFKIHYHNIAKNTSNEGIKSKSNNESVQFKRQIEKEVRLVADDHDENSKQMDTSSHEDDSAHDIEAENDVNVMNVRESIHNRNWKKYSDLNEIDKVIDLEENGKEETKGMTSDQEDLVSKYFIDGEWTKWVPERCTPEEKEIFDKFKERLENYLVEANPRALKEEVTDNLILR